MSELTNSENWKIKDRVFLNLFERRMYFSDRETFGVYCGNKYELRIVPVSFYILPCCEIVFQTGKRSDYYRLVNLCCNNVMSHCNCSIEKGRRILFDYGWHLKSVLIFNLANITWRFGRQRRLFKVQSKDYR